MDMIKNKLKVILKYGKWELGQQERKLKQMILFIKTKSGILTEIIIKNIVLVLVSFLKNSEICGKILSPNFKI